MAQLRVALAQVDTTVGDLTGNASLVREWTKQAAAEGAHVVAFPEMTLTGYPAEDLVLRGSFVQAACTALERLAADLAADGLGELPVVVGYLDRTPDAPRRLGRPLREPQNAAAVLHRGQVVLRSAKHHLPNYGVFDEARYFVPGHVLPVIRLHGVDVAICICEDLWQDGGPIAVAAAAHAGLVAVHQRLPVRAGQDRRPYRAGRTPRRARPALPLPTSTRSAARTSWSSTAARWSSSAEGALLARTTQFEQTLLVTDLDLPLASSDDEGAVDALDGTTWRSAARACRPSRWPRTTPCRQALWSRSTRRPRSTRRW